MALLSESLNIIIFLVTKPFSLFMLTCLFLLKIFVIVIQTWLELLKTSIAIHVNIFWTTLMWIIAFVSLPGRVLAALQRERQLQQDLQCLQIELENVLWERKELQKHFQAAIKEQKTMELMLEELEVIHEKATDKIVLLESELQNLRNENLQMQENKAKGYWSLKSFSDKSEAQKTGGVYDDISYGISSCSASYSGSSMVQDLIQRDAWKGSNVSKAKLIKILESELKTSGLIHPHTAEILSKDEDITEILDEQREVAVSRSLFSTILSLLVGTILWEAEEPHLCLIMALLTVVSISLKSVVDFFTTIKNKPALDAVALLSLNWFVLGMLAYPTLPNISRLLAPLGSRFVGRAVELFGLFIS